MEVHYLFTIQNGLVSNSHKKVIKMSIFEFKIGKVYIWLAEFITPITHIAGKYPCARPRSCQIVRAQIWFLFSGMSKRGLLNTVCGV